MPERNLKIEKIIEIYFKLILEIHFVSMRTLKIGPIDLITVSRHFENSITFLLIGNGLSLILFFWQMFWKHSNETSKNEH